MGLSLSQLDPYFIMSHARVHNIILFYMGMNEESLQRMMTTVGGWEKPHYYYHQRVIYDDFWQLNTIINIASNNRRFVVEV